MFDFQSLRDQFPTPQRATVLDDRGRPALVLNFTVKDDLVRLSVETLKEGYRTVRLDAFVVWEDGSVLVDQNGEVQIHNTPAAVEASYAAFLRRQEVAMRKGGDGQAVRWPDVKVATAEVEVEVETMTAEGAVEQLTAEGIEATAEQGSEQVVAKEAV